MRAARLRPAEALRSARVTATNYTEGATTRPNDTLTPWQRTPEPSTGSRVSTSATAAAPPRSTRSRHRPRDRRGEFVVIAGPSGSGKSTLLQLLGALDRPSGGSLEFEGSDLAAAGDAAARRAPAADRRVRLPAVQPDPDADGRRERRARAGADRASRRRERATAAPEMLGRVGLGGPARTTCPRSSPAASSSASRSRGRSPTSPTCCSPTSRPATSTRRPASRSSSCCAGSGARPG